MPQVCNYFWMRGFGVAALLMACLAMWIVAFGTPVVTRILSPPNRSLLAAGQQQTHRDFGLWRDCVSTRVDVNGTPDTDYHVCDRFRYAEENTTGYCRSRQNTHRFTRGMYTLALILCVAALMCAVLNALGAIPSMITGVAIGLFLVIALGAWIGAFALLARGFCDTSSYSFYNARPGACPVLGVVSFIVGLFAFILNYVLPSGPHDGTHRK